MNLNRMIEAEIANGYGDANAQSKVCQDIILKAISNSSLSGIDPYPLRNLFPVGNSNRIIIACQCVFCGIQGINYERFC